jgi:hypothetical protein
MSVPEETVATRRRMAAEHVERARRAVAEGDHTAAITWLHLAAESAVVALALHHGLAPAYGHWQRSNAARALVDRGVLDPAVPPLLIRLNTERKAAVYEGRPVDLRGRTLEGVLADVDALVAVATRRAP